MRVENREKKKVEKIEAARNKHVKATGMTIEHRTTAKQSIGATKAKETKLVCEKNGNHTFCSG